MISEFMQIKFFNHGDCFDETAYTFSIHPGFVAQMVCPTKQVALGIDPV
jgi:hypothetical protein